MEVKTNVMRILDKNHIHYKEYDYTSSNAISGVDVATFLKEDPKQVFKTIVTMSKSGKYYVFMLPVLEELDFKKCARSVLEKDIVMLPLKDLFKLTGYVHGGCSPIGLKKQFPVIIDESCNNYKSIIFSGGKIGYQVEVNLQDISKVIKYSISSIVKER